MNQIKTKWNPGLYNDKHSFVHRYGEELIDLLQPQQNERILDVGCGSGELTVKIAESAGRVTGIDNSPEMIEEARSKFPEIRFEVADAANFSFDKKFDAIFSNAALHWVTECRKVAGCIYDNLKAGGRFVAEFGGKGNVQTIVSQLRKSLKKRGYKKQAELKLWYFPSVGEYATVLEDAGFRVLMSRHFNRPTRLADEETGIKDWLSMFGDNFFRGIPAAEAEEIKDEIQEKLKPFCFKNGAWYADYKRIRIIAIKEQESR